MTNNSPTNFTDPFGLDFSQVQTTANGGPSLLEMVPEDDASCLESFANHIDGALESLKRNKAFD